VKLYRVVKVCAVAWPARIKPKPAASAGSIRRRFEATERQAEAALSQGNRFLV
jgi:hypothetical protein